MSTSWDAPTRIRKNAKQVAIWHWVAITAGFFRNPEMAVPAAVYILWMNIMGPGLALAGRTAMGEKTEGWMGRATK